MTKKLRTYSNSKTYHIIFKGIDNQDIFYEDEDRIFFLKQISKTKNIFNYSLYAYCLMDNHIHLVLKCENDFLSKIAQSLMIRYVHFFNSKYKRTGPLLQNRFKSKNIESKDYFLRVCRYVHRNPENAGICKTEDYQWSSYKEYLQKEKLVNKKILLYYYNNNLYDFIQYTQANDSLQDLKDFAEYELVEKLTDEQLCKIILCKFNINKTADIPDFFKRSLKQISEKNLILLSQIKGTNISQLSRITRISRAKLRMLFNKKEPAPNVKMTKENRHQLIISYIYCFFHTLIVMYYFHYYNHIHYCHRHYFLYIL